MVDQSMPNKPKLLLIGPLPPPVGGVAEVYKTLLDGGLSDQFDLKMLNIADKKPSIYTKGRFTVRRAFKAIKHCLQLILNMTIFRPKIVYLSISPTKWAGLRDLLFLFIAKRPGVRVIIRLDNSLFYEFYTKSSARIQRWLQKATGCASSIHVQSEIMKKSLRDLVPSSKIRIISNGISKDFISRVKQMKKQHSNGNIILFMGWMVLGKGIIDLIDAFDMIAADVAESELLLAGPWIKEKDKRIIEKRLSKSPFGNRIHVPGPLYGEERIKAYSEAHVVVNPTVLNEGQSNVVTEGIGIGVPVISCNVGAISTVLQHERGGFFIPKHGVEELAGYLKLLFFDKVLYGKMSQFNKIFFKNNFTQELFIENIGGDFHRVLK